MVQINEGQISGITELDEDGTGEVTLNGAFVKNATGIVDITESATVPGGIPAPGTGTIWYRNDGYVIITNDSGVDTALGSGDGEGPSTTLTSDDTNVLTLSGGAGPVSGSVELAFPNITINDNTYVGENAGSSASGQDNILLGKDTAPNASGERNTVIGHGAGEYLADGFYNVIIGGYTMADGYDTADITGSSNVIIGEVTESTGSGSGNVLISANPASADQSDYVNIKNYIKVDGALEHVFIGPGAGENIAGGTNHVFIGNSAGQNVVNGSGHVFLGQNAGSDVGNSTNHIFIGNAAGQEVTGSSNIAIGTSAMNSTAGSSNIAIGTSAMINVTTGSQNVAIGHNTMASVSLGNNNIGIGTVAPAASSFNCILIGQSIITGALGGHISIGNSPTAQSIIDYGTNIQNIFFGVGHAATIKRKAAINAAGPGGPWAGGMADQSAVFGIYQDSTGYAFTDPVVRMQNSGNVGIDQFVGTATPIGSITGNPGDIYFRDSTTSSGVYVHTGSLPDNTSWSLLATSSGPVALGDALFNGNTTDGYDIVITDSSLIVSADSASDTESIVIKPGASSGGNGGDIELTTSNSSNAGDISLTTGIGTVSGGDINLTTGDAAFGNNNIRLTTGDVSSSGGNNIEFTTGTNVNTGGYFRAELGDGDSQGGYFYFEAGDGDSTQGGSFTVLCGDSAEGNGGQISMSAGDALNTAEDHPAGNVTFNAGDAVGFFSGGSVNINGGDNNAGSGDGGQILLTAGTGINGSTGDRGSVVITGSHIEVINSTAIPSGTPSGSGYMYSQAGAGKWKGSSGTVTTFGPAEPHCPSCGRDFGHEWENTRTKELLRICMPCMLDKLDAAGVDTSFAYTRELV